MTDTETCDLVQRVVAKFKLRTGHLGIRAVETMVTVDGTLFDCWERDRSIHGRATMLTEVFRGMLAEDGIYFRLYGAVDGEYVPLGPNLASEELAP